MSGTLPRVIAKASMRLGRRAPFFQVLTLHTEWHPAPEIGTAATDGETIIYNPDFLASLSPAHLEGLVAHEVTHMAMRHCSRRGRRDPERWNIAADIVTNHLVEGMGLTLPNGAIRDKSLEHLSVEEVYARITEPSKADRRKLGSREGHKNRDLLVRGNSEAQAVPQVADDPYAGRWRDAVRKALVVQRMHEQQAGECSLGAHRELDGLLEPQVDWRTMLWRYVVRAPFDYTGWDRRFVHRGVYVEELTGERLTVAACLDTSGSVNPEMLRALLSELQGIRRAHPMIEMVIYFADSRLFGPYRLDRDSDLPMPVGGGGTTFAPFFEAVDRSRSSTKEDALSTSPDLLIYATDGWGEVPQVEPDTPTLWIVPFGQRTDFPWGEVVHMEVE